VCQDFIKGYEDPGKEGESESPENDLKKKKQNPPSHSTDESAPVQSYPLSKYRDLVRKIRSSGDLLQKYSNLAISIGLSGERPPLDVCTRWNSTFAMVAHGLKYKKAVSLLIAAQDWKGLALSDEDWEDLETLQSNSLTRTLTT
jgi:hypothetical protein